MRVARNDPYAIDLVAESWVGTPWCDNSATKGKGACCHLLVASIYLESGWIPYLPDMPRGVATQARWSNRSPILDWMRSDGAAHFEEVKSDPEPGDAVLLKCGRVPHHLSMMLHGGRFIHVAHNHGVQIVAARPVFRKLVAHIFRPL